MKRLTALLMASALVLACVGCGSDAGSTAGDAAPAESAEQDTVQDESEAESGTQEEAGTEDTAEADTDDGAAEAEAEPEETASGSTEEKSEGVMTYEEYAAADLDTEVVVETYV